MPRSDVERFVAELRPSHDSANSLILREFQFLPSDHGLVPRPLYAEVIEPLIQ
jgi:hypothetical protein